MRERRHLLAAILFTSGLALRLVTLSACGGSADDDIVVEVAFTPTATIPIIKDCGDGKLDATEVCDSSAPNGDAACTAQGQSCLCCACLADTETLGTRTFSVIRPGSVFNNNVLGCTDASMNPWLPGPLLLEAGRPDAETCVSPITLKEDVIIGFRQPVGIACLKLIAGGSSGSIDCDGGTPYGVEYEQNSNGSAADSPQVVRTGLGPIADTGKAGNADLVLVNRVTINLQNPPGQPLPDVNECFAINYDNPTADPRIKPVDVSVGPLAFTTRNGRATVLNPVQGLQPGQVDINCPGTGAEFSGANFSCGRWSQEDSEGVLIAPLAALGQLGGALDTANILVIADKPIP